MNENDELLICHERYRWLLYVKPSMALHVFWCIANTMNQKTNECTLSIEDISSRLHRSKSTIYKCINALIKEQAIIKRDKLYVSPEVCVSADYNNRQSVFNTDLFKRLANKYDSI